MHVIALIVNDTFIQMFLLLKFVLNQNVMIRISSKIRVNSLTHAGLLQIFGLLKPDPFLQLTASSLYQITVNS